MRKLVFITLAGMTLGGMVFGPFVQKFAFGAYWTGFPFGGDLTDNKTLIMWVCWLIAAGVLAIKPRTKAVYGKIAVVVAAVVMTAVYLIPHSMRGSELDYGKLEQGVHPSEAVETGE
jgi:Na+/melibiose symporter-like transporter